MKDSTKFFACFCKITSTPMVLNCDNKFDTLKEADKFFDEKLGEPIIRNKDYMTTTIPLCNYFPEFINNYRVINKAKNNLIITKN